MLVLARFNRFWRDAVHIVQSDTVLRWLRDLFRVVWPRKSKPKGQPRRLALQTIELIQRMAIGNPWGVERIRGELPKLGNRVAKRTIQKYMRMVRPPGKRGQSWEAFLADHAGDIWACDFLQLNHVLFRLIFAWFLVKHGDREVVHVGVTRSPSDEWVAQQLREATPFGEGPRFLIRDNDGKYGAKFEAVAKGVGIEVVSIPPRSPNLNAICKRFLESVRRKCLDHVVILGEGHLRRVLNEYVHGYFNVARPHQGIGQEVPGRAGDGQLGGQPSKQGPVVAKPVLGGLHHDYSWAA